VNVDRGRTPVGDCARRAPRPAGTSLVEVMAAVAISGTLAAAAAPALLAGRDAMRVAGAARHLASAVRGCRSQAVQSGTYVALRFSDSDGTASWTTYQDGNRNGVRSADVTRGIDIVVGAVARLTDAYPAVRFGIVPGTTEIETGSPLVGGGIRFGSGNWLSCSPSGSASSGSLYVRGDGPTQFAVRVLGVTGRVRVLRFDPQGRQWSVP
jgi:Tfp pilus assembly protein FimT